MGGMVDTFIFIDVLLGVDMIDWVDNWEGSEMR
jgi:hypothetical protein